MTTEPLYSPYVGLYHYNKHLDISDDEALKKLRIEECDFVVTKQGDFIDHAIPEEYQMFLDVLKKYDIDFYRTYMSIVNPKGSGRFSGQNMFITSRKQFNAYCNFLFPLLEQVYACIGDGDESAYHKRYCAFFAERLLTPWMVHNNLRYCEAPIKMIGPWYYMAFLKIYYSRFNRFIPNKAKPVLQRLIRRSSY